ncbi:N-acetylmuramoyl-L-alanine amidase [Isachenkonia alkalipeptolytica]|uniref:N-acetylmuramoyl-L-alanine amidase n=1 Tax=Isachenkonia alkalipeptolytica TaxID=2565777 RepID=A0AA44BFM9_9CLOT|nr:N-acetylmuramoyl-L-alanine amidase [Isachenkonia alkalipeptolytica]NBG88646.1 N-acetylmuramoyl-L-alanine amidase [Isachenkonia alkalipeptolytica]
MRKIRVVIDPGHGGEDRWNRGPTGYIEADGVLKISKYLKEELEKTGHFEVKLTREKDQTLSRKQRAEIARDFKADLFISEHTNAFNGTAKGTEVYYSVKRPKDMSFAGKMSRAIATHFRTHNRGAKNRLTTKRDDYYGILYYGVLYHIPSILLIESLFHDHVEEEKILLEDQNLRDLAEVQCEAIKDYYGIQEEEGREKAMKEDSREETPEKLYRVQVGAFREKENALRMIEALENDGYPTYLVPPR